MKHLFINTLLVLILLSVTIFSSVVPAHAAPSSAGITTPAEMEAFLEGVFTSQMEAQHIAGAVVTVVKDGDVFFSKGYGQADVANQVRVSPDQTLFRIGSTSKLFIWTSVMQLVEQGKLDLGADVNTYLDFKIPDAFSKPITMKNLMTHTPGFEEIEVGLFAYDEDHLISLGDFLKTHIPARVFAPGEVSAYSNYGAALAGYIVERVSGMSFNDYVEQNIFQPLGMNHSTFRQPLPADFAPDMSEGYVYSDGKYQQGSFELIPPYPAGSASSTADDIAKFMIAHLQNGLYGNARILSDATAQQMHSELGSGMAYGFFTGQVNGQTVIDHGGDTDFFHTGFYLLPDQNVGIFFSTNAEGGSDARNIIFQSFMDHYYPAQAVTQPTPPADMANRAAQYEGEYFSARSNFTGVEKIETIGSGYQVSVDEDGYVLVSSGDTARRYVEVEPGVLQRLDNPSIKLTLTVNEDGRTYLLNNPVRGYIKSVWYQTDAFQMFLWGVSLLFLLITLIGWAISFFTALIKRQPRPFIQRLARISGVIFIALLIAFLVGFFGEIANAEPLTGIPMFIFEMPNSLPQILMIPPVMVIIGIVLTIFTVIAWVKRFWTFGGRFHYTLFTISAWAVLWELAYLNLLKI